MNLRVKLLFIALLGLISSASAGCSIFEKISKCNPASKGAFATAFAAAAAVPAVGCHSMTPAEWARVGCDSPYSHKSTKICAPATWSPVLKLFAKAMALKSKVLFRSPYNRAKLFYSSKGRALVRHELAHIRQQAGVNSWRWGYRYISGYCDAGCSYENNRYEVDARKYENDNC